MSQYRNIKHIKGDNPEEYEKCSRDIHLKEIKEISNYILSQLSNLINSKPELKDVIEYALDQPVSRSKHPPSTNLNIIL